MLFLTAPVFASESISKERELEIQGIIEEALKDIRAQKYLIAENNLEIIKLELTSKGYKNIHETSAKVLALTKGVETTFDRLRIVNLAVKLSPNHPETLFSAATNVFDVGFLQASKYLISGFRSLPNYPYYLSSLLVKMGTVFLFSFFATVVCWNILGIFFCSVDVLTFIASVFSKPLRTKISFFCSLILILIVTTTPVVYSAVVSATVLAFSSNKMRSGPFALGLILSASVLFSPLFVAVVGITSSPTGRVYEGLRMNDFMFNTESILNSSGNNYEYKDLFNVLLGQTTQSAGKIEDAKKHYYASLGNGIYDDGLKYFIESNLAILEFQNGNMQVAFDKWKLLFDKGWREKELLHNLCIASVNLFKKDEFEKYFSELQRRYKIEHFDTEKDIKPIPSILPSSVYLSTITRRIKNLYLTNVFDSQSQIFPYLEGISLKPFFAFCVSYLIFGLFLLKGNKNFHRYRVSSVYERSSLNKQYLDRIKDLPTFTKFLNHKSVFVPVVGIRVFFVAILWFLPVIIPSSTHHFAYLAVGLLMIIELSGALRNKSIRRSV